MPQNKNRRRDLFHTYIGFPGYRTRPDRSGLDPVDTYREEAFMEGMFLKRLFTLKLRTSITRTTRSACPSAAKTTIDASPLNT